jgi:hypothetical protein
MIPCKENKCILLPICKPCTDITCDELFDYYEKSTALGKTKEERWANMNKILPNLDHIMIKIGYHSGYSYFRDS